MENIVEEIIEELAEESKIKREAKIRAYVKGKLKRVEVIETSIQDYQDELTKIQESLSYVEEGDYADINFTDLLNPAYTGCWLSRSINYKSDECLYNFSK